MSYELPDERPHVIANIIGGGDGGGGDLIVACFGYWLLSVKTQDWHLNILRFLSQRNITRYLASELI